MTHENDAAPEAAPETSDLSSEHETGGTASSGQTRKRLDPTVVEREEAVGEMFAHANEVRYVVSLSGILETVSPNCRAQTGYEPEELKGKAFRDFLHPKDTHICQAYINKVVSEGSVQKGFIYRFQHKDGTPRHHSANGFASKGKDGQLCCLVIIVTDISEQKQLWTSLKENQDRLDLAAEAAGYALWEIRLDSDVTSTSAKIFEDLGYSREQAAIHKDAVANIIHPEDLAVVRAAMGKHFRREESNYHAEFRVRAKNGQWRWFMSTGMLVEWNESGDPMRMLGLVGDVTNRKVAESRLQQTAAAMQTIFDSSPIGVAVADMVGEVLYCNTCLARMGNMPRDMLIGSNLTKFYADQKHLRILFKEFKAKGSLEDHEVRISVPGNKRRWALTTWTAMEYEGKPAILTWMYEITERKHMEEKLRALATTDGLTGLHNRRYFLVLAEREFDRTRRYGHPLSMIMFDADYFKKVNDTYGHDVGDQVLRMCAKIGRNSVRDVDVLARIGGEEFAVLLPSTNAEGAYVVAERIRQAIGTMAVPSDKGEVNITVSCGVAQATSNTEDVRELLKMADKALYAAKEAGRNKVKLAM